MLLTLIFPLSLISPGLLLLDVLKIPIHRRAERIALSYVISISLMFVILYLGAIFLVFNVASFALLFVVLLSTSLLLLSRLKKYYSRDLSFSRFYKLKLEEKTVLFGLVGLLIIYVIVLLSRSLLDSDVVQFYLPIAREITSSNGLTYSTGYDYNVLLKPIGVSVLYAWTYTISGTILLEPFRLLPIVPIIILIIIMYLIAREVTDSHILSVLATGIFLIMPFQDRFLLYSAFYPDIFYYPLIFLALYFIIKYMKGSDRSTSTFVFVGIAVGAASLLKAQSIYVIITIVFLILIVNLNRRSLAAVFCSLIPFVILLPNLLAESIQRDGFILSFNMLTIPQIAFLVFLGTIVGGMCYWIRRDDTRKNDWQFTGIKRAIRHSVSFLIPAAAISSLWYITNLLRFGSLLYTSSANLPNYEWAFDIIEPILSSPSTSTNISDYFFSFWFMFVDPAVMGYVWLVPLLIGFYYAFRKRTRDYDNLLLTTLILAVIIFSQVIYKIPEYPTSTYNPRDIFLLAPLLSITAASGILMFVSLIFNESSLKRFTPSLAILVVAYFGFMSYVHSVVVWFAYSVLSPPFWIRLLRDLAYLFGLNLQETSFQLPMASRVTFIGVNFGLLFAFSLVVATPLLIMILFRYFPRATNTLYRQFGSLYKGHQRFLRFAGKSIVLISIISIIMIPRGYAFLQVGMPGFTTGPINTVYGPLAALIVNQEEILEGDLITFQSPDGLPYYLPERRIIDLRWPANLGFLKEILLSESANEAVMALKQLGINHFLFSSSDIAELDRSLDMALSNITSNPELAALTETFGKWNLYNIGPYEIYTASIPLSGWVVHPQFTGAPYSFVSNESGILLEVFPINTNNETLLYEDRVTLLSSEIPRLNLSDYDFVTLKLEGSANAKILFRFILSNESSISIGFWDDVYVTSTSVFDLRTFTDNIYIDIAILGLVSEDNNPAWIHISEILFVKIL